MDVVLKGRGSRITDQLRDRIEHKLAKMQRLEPRLRRIEVQVIQEANPRIDGGHRVEVAAEAARHVFRAHGAGGDVDAALDQVVERLERQISSYRGKLLGRRKSGSEG